MAKLILCVGQSLMDRMFTVSSGTLTPHADTHMWNGTTWTAPTGDGAITYCNLLRMALGQPIYVVNACVGNTPLTNYGDIYNTAFWACAAGSLMMNAIAQTLAAKASVSGLELDRVEWWHGQYECYTGGWYDMFTAYRNALALLNTGLRAGLGTDYSFSVWPLGRCSTGTTIPIVSAQMDFATNAAAVGLGIEPGPGSYDRGYIDNVHLYNAAEYMWMGIRGARNAKSYFDAKAAGTHRTKPHDGAGPIIESLVRHPAGNLKCMFAVIRSKSGLLTTNAWNDETTWLNGFRVRWMGGDYSAVPVTGTQLVGSWAKLCSTWDFLAPSTVSYMAETSQSSADPCGTTNVVYDTNTLGGSPGQPMLPLALGSLTSG